MSLPLSDSTIDSKVGAPPSERLRAAAIFSSV